MVNQPQERPGQVQASKGIRSLSSSGYQTSTLMIGPEHSIPASALPMIAELDSCDTISGQCMCLSFTSCLYALDVSSKLAAMDHRDEGNAWFEASSIIGTSRNLPSQS